jgi:hypothetical protein
VVANFVPLCARPISKQNDRLSIASSRVNSAEMKAARSPHFEAGGKRRRASAGAEGAHRGAPARSVSMAPPQPGRGIECDRSEALCLQRLRRTTSGIVTRMGGDARTRDDNKTDRLSGSGRSAARAPARRGRAKKDVPYCTEGRENFPRLNPRLNGAFSLGLIFAMEEKDQRFQFHRWRARKDSNLRPPDS